MILLNILFLLICSYGMIVSTNPTVKYVNGAAVVANLAAIAIHFGG